MAEDKNSFFNESGKAGLVLAAAATAYFILSMLIGKTGMSGFVAGTLGFLLWAAKVWLCIYLMVKYLRDEAGRNGKDRSRTFRFGCMVALCSALVYAAAYLFYVMFIDPETFSHTFDTIAQLYSGSFTTEQMDTLMNMEASMPTVSFFVNLLWCSLFGTVISAIASSRICGPDNPFEE